jgi:cellulose biosynthesis protein BcsQ
MKLHTFDPLSSRIEAIRRFTDMSDPEELHELVMRLRPALRNVIGSTIGKGGECKTTLAVNCANALAEQEAMRAQRGEATKPILYLELDANGNGRLDLGIRGGEYDDDGMGLYDAITGDKEFKVVKDVRPFLDMAVSGGYNGEIPSAITKMTGKYGLASYLLLALLLAQISHLYRWIVLDFSPGDKEVQRLGLACCTHLMVPIKGADGAVIDGLGTLANRVRQVRRLNPELGIAALAFIGYRKVSEKATSELIIMRRDIRTLLQQANVNDEVLIDAFVREGRGTMKLARNYGLPVKEFALACAGQLIDEETGEPVPRPRDGEGRLADTQRAIDLANDYTQLTAEVIRQVRKRNKRLRGEQG